MSRTIAVEIVGDAASVDKAFASASASATSWARTSTGAYKEVGLSAEKSAQIQVAAAVKSAEAQRAKIASLQNIAASSAPGSAEQVAATNLATAAQLRLAKSYGATTTEAKKLSPAARTAERDIGKATRGALAGSGVFHGLGRSLAFASGGYLAFAGGFDIISKSIDAARQLAVVTRQDAVQLKAVGESWSQYRGQVEKTTLALSQQSGFTNKDLLGSFGLLARSTGDATQALKLNALAADVARGRGISLTSAAVALGKAWDGDTTSLKRLGVEVPKGVSGLQAIQAVQEKFAGQAKAGASAADRFNATLTDTEEVIGKAILPTVNKYLGELADWLTKMQRSGRLQHDVNTAVHDGATVFHAIGAVIKTVDRVTGSFLHTLELLAAFKFARMISGWSGALTGLIAKWRGVTTAAETAEGAEAGAAGVGAGAGAGVLGAIGGPAAVGLGVAAFAAFKLSQSRDRSFNVRGGRVFFADGKWYFQPGNAGRAALISASQAQQLIGGPIPGGSSFHLNLGAIGADSFQLAAEETQQHLAALRARRAASATTDNQPLTLPFNLQLAQAKAGATATTRDDLQVLKEIRAFILKAIPKLHGQKLIDAYNQLGQVNQEIAADVTKAAKVGKDFVVPMALQIADARDQALNISERNVLVKMKQAAEKALRSGKLSGQGQIDAWNEIASVNQQLATQAAQVGKAFTVPLKLQLAEAKAQAEGVSDTSILLKMKRAAERALKSGKLSIQGQIDAWNEIASINQQLASSATSALGQFKELNTRKLVDKIKGLTAAQRKELRAELSQIGPHGTVPGSGVGAFGYAIGRDGRPREAHHRRHRHHHVARAAERTVARRNPTISEAQLNRTLLRLEKIADRPIHLTVDLDGKPVANVVTRHQQRRRRRNSSQRRGPNAGN